MASALPPQSFTWMFGLTLAFAFLDAYAIGKFFSHFENLKVVFVCSK
jgi:hypothetical protein